MSKIREDILRVLPEGTAPSFHMADIVRALPQHDAWELRVRVWEILAEGSAELTLDWKLRKAGSSVCQKLKE